VVRCEPCDAHFFTRPPDFTIWNYCHVRNIAFTKDPQEIDVNTKLNYDLKLVSGIEIYRVYPASRSDIHV
jgi:hypothetical protein